MSGEAVGIDHVTIAASELGPAVRFYDAALGALGWSRLAELVDEEEDDAQVEAVGWGVADGEPRVWVVAASDRPATSAAHVRLRAGSRDEVTTFWTSGAAAGGREHSAPRRWTIYRRGEFGATLADPDGNLIEVVAPE